MRVQFDSASFELSHGRKPKGFGSWAFHPDANVDACSPEIIWVNQSKFADARKTAAKVATERGWDFLAVLS